MDEGTTWGLLGLVPFKYLPHQRHKVEGGGPEDARSGGPTQGHGGLGVGQGEIQVGSLEKAGTGLALEGAQTGKEAGSLEGLGAWVWHKAPDSQSPQRQQMPRLWGPGGQAAPPNLVRSAARWGLR